MYETLNERSEWGCVFMINIKKIICIVFACAICFSLNIDCVEISSKFPEDKTPQICSESKDEVSKAALTALKEAYNFSCTENWQKALDMDIEALKYYKEKGEREKVNYYEINKYICEVNLNLAKSKEFPSPENFENLEKHLLEASYALSSVGRIEEARMYLVMSTQARIKKNYLQVRESPSADGWRRIENLCSYAYKTYKNTERKSSQYFHIYSITAKAHADYLQAQNENSLKSWKNCKESSERAFRKFLIIGDYSNCNIMKSRIEICNCNIIKLST